MNPAIPGLFGIPAPLLDRVDLLLGFLPAGPRLALWGAAAGAASMWLYALISPQRRIAALKREIVVLRGELEGHREDFSAALPLLMRQVRLSMKHVGIALGPAVLAGLPVLAMLAWVPVRHGYDRPDPGTPVLVSVDPAADGLAWEPAGPGPERPGAWRVEWPAEGAGLRLVAPDGSALLALPLAAPVPVVQKRRWWHALFGNPLGDLPRGAPVDAVLVDLPRRRFLPFGPPWLAGWEAVFFGAVVAASVAVKLAFRIH